MLALLSQPRACLRCLRFPLTFYYHRGNMKRKVHQELCRKTNSYIVTPCFWPKLANPLERASMRHAPVSILFLLGIFCLFCLFGHTSSEAAGGRRRGRG